MLFEHRFVDLPPLTETTKDGKRHYKTKDGNIYPSVTTILSHGPLPVGLTMWRNRVGHAEADKITRAAAVRGDAIHKLCERYVRNDPEYLKEADPEISMMFGDMRPFINKIGPIYAVEAALYSDKYRFAGRTDVIGEYAGVDAIIDFKGSSSEVTPLSDKVYKYGHQLGAYGIAWEEMTGQKIDWGILIFGSPQHGAKTFRVKLEEHKKIFLEIREEYGK